MFDVGVKYILVDNEISRLEEDFMQYLNKVLENLGSIFVSIFKLYWS